MRRQRGEITAILSKKFKLVFPPFRFRIDSFFSKKSILGSRLDCRVDGEAVNLQSSTHGAADYRAEDDDEGEKTANRDAFGAPRVAAHQYQTGMHATRKQFMPNMVRIAAQMNAFF